MLGVILEMIYASSVMRDSEFKILGFPISSSISGINLLKSIVQI